jgi:hypothetical protein
VAARLVVIRKEEVMFGLFRVVGVLVRGWFAILGLILVAYFVTWGVVKVCAIAPTKVDPKLLIKIGQMDPHDPRFAALVREARRQAQQK